MLEIKLVIGRGDISSRYWGVMKDNEQHHNHRIVQDGMGRYLWEEKPEVVDYVNSVGLYDVLGMLRSLGYGKNSEIYRQLYRDMGYSLYGYWEVFYWEMNNEEAENYEPPTNNLVLMENLYKKLQERSDILSKRKNTKLIDGRVAELLLITVEVQTVVEYPGDMGEYKVNIKYKYDPRVSFPLVKFLKTARWQYHIDN